MNTLSFVLYILFARPKTVVNLWHLRSMNGMAFYAIDSLYSSGFEAQTIFVFRSRTISNLFRENLGSQILFYDSSFFSYAFLVLPLLIIYNLFSSVVVDSPTCHPLPFLRNQKIVLHDTYPFAHGGLAILRRSILYFSLLVSRTCIRYINKSDSLSFALSLSRATFSPGIFYVPNRFPEPVVFTPLPFTTGHLVIGLVGSSSSKKNYAFLLERMMSLGFNHASFLVYGLYTHYLYTVVRSTRFSVDVCDSNKNSFGQFFASIHILVNIAEYEGFCRPVAAAVASGVPVYLLDTPVMQEFYSGSDARIFPVVDNLLQAVARDYPPMDHC